ncbi:MAG: hypothetical protein Q7R48_00060 [bacterium]|nr:hypothetical protein [bacterium]
MSQQRSEGLKEFLNSFLRDSPKVICLLAATIRFRRAFKDPSKGDSSVLVKEVAARKAEFLRAGFSEDEARDVIAFVMRKDAEGRLEDLEQELLEQELATKEGL